MTGLNLAGRKIGAEKRTDISITYKPDESENQEDYQQLDQSTHFACPYGLYLFCPIYIWPFEQDHVIHIKMSGIKHSMAEDNLPTPQYRLKKTVALVGLMGAGKTAVGRAVAARLNVPFLDSDAEIEAAANQTVQEIFERDGEPFFRLREAEVIARLLERENVILSTGGGAYLAEQNRFNIGARGVALWLNADLDLLWNRVRHKDTRPLLRTPDPRATLAALFEKRVPLYSKAELSVKCQSNLSIEAMADKVIETLLTRPDVLELEDA